MNREMVVLQKWLWCDYIERWLLEVGLIVLERL